MKIPFWRRKRDEELDAELQSHLQMAAREHGERGELPKQARESARREMGNMGLVKDATREAWGSRWLRDFVQDLRYGVRTLRGNPSFTCIAVLTIALGVGANTAIFSLVDAVMLRNLPVSHPEQLVEVARVEPARVVSAFSYPAFRRIRDENRTLSGVFAIGSSGPLDAKVDGKTEIAKTYVVSGNFFSLLGIDAAAGRTFTSEQDKSPGADPVAVISYEYWSRRFHRDRAILNKQMILGSTTVTILGVAPRNFYGVSVGISPDVYLPMMMAPEFNGKGALENGRFIWIEVIGRLKAGTTRAEATADLAVVFSRIQTAMVENWLQNASAQTKQNTLAERITLLSAASGLNFGYRTEFSNPLLILMGISGLVLLIACANVANLLLARSALRRKEMAIKVALGAGKLRLVRQLLTESLLLAFTGGFLGFVVAMWSVDGIVALMSFGGAPLKFNLNPDFRMFAFAGAVSLVVAIAFGLAPAMRSSRVDVTPALKETSRGEGVSLSRNRVGKTLVVSQVAISLILLFGAGLLVRTLINLKALDPGFDRNNVLLFEIDAAAATNKTVPVSLRYKEILEKLEGIPGVRYASAFNVTPLSAGISMTAPTAPEDYVSRANEDLTVNLNSVGPHYFETLDSPILQGRGFEMSDTEKSPAVAIINQTMAAYYFGDASPIGKRIQFYDVKGKDVPTYTVIGVVKDAKYGTLREQIPRTMYLDLLQGKHLLNGFEVRTTSNPASFAPQIRAAIQSINTGAKVTEFETLADHVDSTLGHERLMVILCSLFAGLAGLLACIGLYGVTAYGVAQRRSEIGIRMALGAQQSDVLRMVQRETLRLVFFGIVIGLPAGVLASRLISSTLFNLKPSDPWTMAAASLFMMAVALLAGFVPARAASRVDPMRALRSE